MSDAAQVMSALLEEEHYAALEADVGRLHALQEEKQVALAQLQAAGISPEFAISLGERARSNVALMRNLVSLLRGLAHGGEDATYGHRGQQRESMLGRRRGAL